MLTFKPTAVVVALSALAAAQTPSLSDLSPDCRGAITAIQGNQQAANCTNFAGLLNILLVPANQSLIQPIDLYLQKFCATTDCPNSVIQEAATNITTGCATDLASAGVSDSEASNVASLIQTFLPLGKEVACLSDKDGTPQFCVTEVLKNVQTFIGEPLSLANIKLALPTITGDAISIAHGQGSQTLPANITCTNCAKAAYVLLKQELPGQVGSPDVQNAITAQCGADFAAATALPDNIFEGTGTAVPAPTQTGAAAQLGAPAGLLALVGTVAALFA